MDSKSHSILACPQCHGDLLSVQAGLACKPCQLLFSIEDGIPILLRDKASKLSEEIADEPKGDLVHFEIVEGNGSGSKVSLKQGACKAIGRSLDNFEKTKVFGIGNHASLDEMSKKLVISYVGKQFDSSAKNPDGLGGFQRSSDWHLDDLAVSRLHAMIFYGEAGVGILDLVSRNGTYVNELEIESKLLDAGDTIRLGGIKLKYAAR